MDLFTPVVPEDRMHPNFLHTIRGAAQEDRDVLSDWAVGFADRDGKMVHEFQTTYNSVFWELYLFAALKNLGYKVDFSVDRPDFVAHREDAAVIMEATVASNASGRQAEWQGTARDFIALESRDPIVHEATVRLCNALTAKYRKYVEEYSKLEHVAGRPFVIAVAPFDQPHTRVQNTEAIFQALYAGTATPYEDVEYHPDGSVSARGGEFIPVPSVEKRPGVNIELGFFRDKRMRQVSAVLFSSVASWGKVRALSKDPNPHVYFETLRANLSGPEPFHCVVARDRYVEHLLDGVVVFHNPDADHPLSWEALRGPMVTQVAWPREDVEPTVESSQGVLLQRTVTTLRVTPDDA